MRASSTRADAGDRPSIHAVLILWQRLVFRPVETAQNAWSRFLVAPPAFRTPPDTVCLGGAQAVSMPTHPAALHRRHPQHKRIVRHIPPHHRSRANEGIAPNRRPTDNGGIGPNRGPAAPHGARILIVPHDLCPGVHDIRKDTRRPTEDIVFEFHPRINRDVVLNLDVIPNDHIRRHMHILPENAALPNASPDHHMAKMPDLRPSTNGTWLVDIRTWMDIIRRRHSAARTD